MEFVTVFKFSNNILSTENKTTIMNVKLSLHLIQHSTMKILWGSGVYLSTGWRGVISFMPQMLHP
jgi:hypothetical protein